MVGEGNSPVLAAGLGLPPGSYLPLSAGLALSLVHMPYQRPTSASENFFWLYFQRLAGVLLGVTAASGTAGTSPHPAVAPSQGDQYPQSGERIPKVGRPSP